MKIIAKVRINVFNVISKTIRFFLCFLSLILLIIGASENNSVMVFVSILLLFVNNILYSAENIKDRIVYFVFNGTFFLFEMGLLFVNFIQGHKLLDFSDDIIMHTVISIYISLFSINIGMALYRFYNRKKENTFKIQDSKYIKQKHSKAFVKNTTYISNIAKVSLFIFYVLFPFRVIFILEKVIYVMHHGYVSYYTDFNTALPFIFIKFSDMCVISFYIYLSTLPERKKLILPAALITSVSILSLLFGQRNIVALDLAVLFIYIVIRNYIEDENYKTWIKKRHVVLIICIIFLCMVGFEIYGYIRIKKSFNYQGLGNTIVSFLKSQGDSVSIISYGKKYDYMLPRNGLYTLNQITLFLNNNILSKAIFGYNVLMPQSQEMALHGTSFASSIAYIINPIAYLNGAGYGSNYIAEVYFDFGYIGLVIFNIFVGMLLGQFAKSFQTNPWWKNCIILIMIRNIIYIPRSETLSFITNAINMINLLTIFGVYIISKEIYRKCQNNLRLGTKSKIC